MNTVSRTRVAAFLVLVPAACLAVAASLAIRAIRAYREVFPL